MRLPPRGSEEELDDSKLRADAWNFVDQDPEIDLNAASLGVQGERAAKYDVLQLIYELKNGNVFTKENLKLIQKTERELFANEVFRQKLCLKTQSIQCKQPTSIIRFFDGSYQKLHMLLNDPEFDNIPRVLSAAGQESTGQPDLTNANGDIEEDKDASLEYAGSSHTRLVTRLFEGVFFDKVVGHKVVRWIIIVVFTVFICLSVTYATRIEVDEEQVI